MFTDSKPITHPFLVNKPASSKYQTYIISFLVVLLCVSFLKQQINKQNFTFRKHLEKKVGGGTASKAMATYALEEPQSPQPPQILSPKVALCGLDPSTIDYSQEHLVKAGITKERLEGALFGDQKKLQDLGYEVDFVFIPVPRVGEGYEIGLQGFGAKQYDAILIGAGVRKNDVMFYLFEKLINAAHVAAPQAKICFNSGPFDSADAVQRWVPIGLEKI